ncbi:MAG TPA: cytosol nonspecific dipeptidase [Bacteroidales bacterium]|nr:MAG: cytosol nonspecific dipeptidase [Bacteroidetes bacterium GWE2_42_24]OFY29549.1 MAG: cytosol nonspecific dipeptidase [Bacteroidetes bacterium GWF2_43_11]HAQ64754.1 cytosol nonspecific dipeptidase [Bacteroidales bacterium]HBZ67352.1 cytosol nonspecific dipeptidase [Bacteroidales bacterium]
MSILSDLEPKDVWTYFEQITRVPRPSKREEKIRDFLMAFGKNFNLDTRSDTIGNVVICKPATPGYDDRPVVILQSHMDMVCEKNSDLTFDFNTDPIQPIVDGEWVKANGTTLGADDGIGIAAQMAILAATNLKHGPIECLFTVDEETGLTGANALEPGFLKGETLLNLDSEDEGELFIGCAGGIDTVATLAYERKPVPKRSHTYRISIKGLKGGHSGDDIHKGHGNSNKILNRFLWTNSQDLDLRLAWFDGGNLRNAIPREANAVVVLPQDFEQAFLDRFEKYAADIRNELSLTDEGVMLSVEKVGTPEFVINRKAQTRLLNALYACPHGVFSMSYSMPGMVETSTNLASVKFIDDNMILITSSQRSDRNSSRFDIANMVESVFLMAGCDVKHSDGYPGWQPNPDSVIAKHTADTYERLFGIKPIVRSIHAGLECGLFLEKYPTMDMVSFGPTLRGVHSPDEKIHIGTVVRFYDLLLEVLATIPPK